MKWLAIAAWIGLSVLGWSYWERKVQRNVQTRVARQRPNLDRNTYRAEMARSGVDITVSDTLYDELSEWCVNGVRPHPDDGFIGFYMNDADQLEDFLELVFHKLGLLLPPPSDPQFGPQMESVRDLAIHLQAQRGN